MDWKNLAIDNIDLSMAISIASRKKNSYKNAIELDITVFSKNNSSDISPYLVFIFSKLPGKFRTEIKRLRQLKPCYTKAHFNLVRLIWLIC